MEAECHTQLSGQRKAEENTWTSNLTYLFLRMKMRTVTVPNPLDAAVWIK